MFLFRHIQHIAIICGVLMISLFIGAAHNSIPAQEIPPVEDSQPEEAEDKSMAQADENLKEGTIIKDIYGDEYVPGTMQNISKLYWGLGVFNTEDIQAIDTFLRINECEIYQNYYRNDFEWSKIRSITQEMLKEDREEFPKKFKFVLPVSVGRYDHERQGFPLLDSTGFVNSYRVELSTGFDEICGTRVAYMNNPYEIMLIIEDPLTYNFIELGEHAAQAYILRKQYLLNKRIQKYRQIKYDRLSFIRLRVTFEKYQGNINTEGSRVLAAVYGKIDGIDFFEDPYEQMLLKSVNFENGEIVEVKDHTNTETIDPTNTNNPNETETDTPQQPQPEQ